MIDCDDIDRLAKQAAEAVEAWREDTEDNEELLDNADYALTLLRMAMGEEAFSNAHWFSAAHKQVIKQLDGQKKPHVEEETLKL